MAVFSVIIPVFNKWELTEACLRSLREHTQGDDFEVIVVNNASTDETSSALEPLGKELFGQQFIAINHNENINFGPGSNSGAARASAPVLFFLNNDTLLTPGWAEPLLQALADNPRLGAVGPLLLYEDNTVQHVGVTCGAECVTHLYVGLPRSLPFVKKERYVQFLTGAAIMIPKKVFETFGGFYPEFRNGFEDIDLCVQIGRAGLLLKCIPQSVIYHLESQTPGRKNADNEWHNGLLLLRRCERYLQIDMHRHALKDGFTLTLDGLLRACIVEPPNVTQELARTVSGQSMEAVLDLFNEHPFWVEGCRAIARVLYERKQYAESFYYWHRLITLYTEKESISMMLRLVQESGDARLQEYMRKDLEFYEGTLKKIGNPVAFMDKLLQKAEVQNDNFLQKLFTAKKGELRSSTN